MRVFACLAFLMLCAGSLVSQAAAQESPLATVDLRGYMGGDANGDVRILRILNSHTFITARAYDAGKPASIDFWDVPSGKIITRILPSVPLDETDLTLSDDAQVLVAAGTFLVAQPDTFVNEILVWKVADGKLIRTIMPDRGYHVNNAVFAPGNAHRLLITSITGNSSAIRYPFQVIDAATGKVLRQFLYQKFVNLEPTRTVFSPSGHRIAQVDAGDRGGGGSIFDGQGRFVTEFSNAEIGRDVDSVAALAICTAFQSETKLFCDGFLYDLRAKTLRRALTGSNANLPCVAAVPSRPGYAFYLGKKGLELWNFTTQTRVRRWPRITRVDGLYFSQDNRVLAVLDGQRLSLWPFNAKSLP